MPAKILLAGEGGQGVQVVAKIIAHAAQKSGKKTTYLPNFGVEQRGGVSLAFVQTSSNNITYPRFSTANIIVAFSNRSIETIKNYLSDRTLLIFDNSIILQKNIDKIKDKTKNYLAIPAGKIAKEKYSSKVANMVLLGAISNQFKDIFYGEFEKAILKEFEEKIKKKPEIKDFDLNAFKEGVDLAEKFDANKVPFAGTTEKESERNFNKGKISWHRFPEYCKGCNLCIVTCPVHALKPSDDLNFLGTQMPIVDMEKCIGCEKCMHICPEGAIRVENEKK